MNNLRLFIVFLLITFSSGCANRDHVYESLYEGLEARERIVNPERPKPPDDQPMNYQQYKWEREKLPPAKQFGVAMAQEATEIGVKTMPPVVVKTLPQAGATDVDPSITEIRVTFSKDMMTQQMWSWVKVSDETFPKITGEIRYLEDKRTCVAPVKLEPGRTYVIWFNSSKFNSFRDEDNNPAIPYLLVFQTRK